MCCCFHGLFFSAVSSAEAGKGSEGWAARLSRPTRPVDPLREGGGMEWNGMESHVMGEGRLKGAEDHVAVGEGLEKAFVAGAVGFRMEWSQ